MPTIPEIIEALPIILSLIVIEGLLSVDNALAIAAMAGHLPMKQRYQALKLGIIGAYVFRGVVLAFAHYIISNPWLKIVGAAYLLHLMASHFAHREPEHHTEESLARKRPAKGFWPTVLSIELMDLSLSVDNVVAAVAMSPKLWVVCTGVFLGIIALRFVAGWCIRLIEKYPVLADTAYVLIGYVGVILLVELVGALHVSALQKFAGILAIVAVSIGYARMETVRRGLRPAFAVARWPMVGYAKVSDAIFGALFFPFRWATRLVMKKAGASAEPAEKP